MGNKKRKEVTVLYHGSENKFDVLKRHQAWGPPGTPALESLDAIYFSPDFPFALSCGANPEGINDVNHDEKTIHFENPEKFDPEKEVYVYIVDPSRIPNEKKILIDPYQVALDLDEITPDRIETYKAGELIKYYSII